MLYLAATAGKSLHHELGKMNPFESPEKEAMLNIVRTSDQFQNRLGKLFRSFGLTGSQHNVLRILRGEGRPMQCMEIRRRCDPCEVSREPAATESVRPPRPRR